LIEIVGLSLSLIHPLSLIPYGSSHYCIAICKDIYVFLVLVYIFRLALWLVAILIQKVWLFWIERPLHCEGNVKVGVSYILHHDFCIYESRLSNSIRIDLVEIDLRLQVWSELFIEEVGKFLIVWRSLYERFYLLIDELHRENIIILR